MNPVSDHFLIQFESFKYDLLLRLFPAGHALLTGADKVM